MDAALQGRKSSRRTKTVKRFLFSAQCALAFAAGAVTAAVAVTAPQVVISQKGREFNPGEVSISRGETIQIVNDDGDLLHHAYIDSKKFSFDSGDQQPGSKTNITFPESGDFNVLCAIHPKMKLTVHVK
jgi:plastocyanin